MDTTKLTHLVDHLPLYVGGSVAVLFLLLCFL